MNAVFTKSVAADNALGEPGAERVGCGDPLLPKLLSGEIQVRQAEKVIEVTL